MAREGLTPTTGQSLHVWMASDCYTAFLTLSRIFSPLSQLDCGMPFEYTQNWCNTSSTWLVSVSNPLLGPLFIIDQWFFIEITFPQQDCKFLLSGTAGWPSGPRTRFDECWVSDGSLSSFWNWAITSFENIHKFIQTNLGSFPVVFL